MKKYVQNASYIVLTITSLSICIYLLLLSKLKSYSSTHHNEHLKKELSQNYIQINSSFLESKFNKIQAMQCVSTPSSGIQGIKIHWNNFYWQQIEDKEIYLYRAFYDIRTKVESQSYHYVRILSSVRKSEFGKSVFCHLWLNNANHSVYVEGDLLEIWLKEWDTNANINSYLTVLISCPVPRKLVDDDMNVTHVSVSIRKCSDLTNKLEVLHHSIRESTRDRPLKREFCVCVKCLNFMKDISFKLIEWIELNRILGAQKIVMYLFDVHPNVISVLKYYESQNFLSVVPISLPGNQPNDMVNRTKYINKYRWQKRRNELISYNDCLYKNIYDFDFIIPLDIDEIILPVKNYNWREMLKDFLTTQHESAKKYSSLSVRNVYFFTSLAKGSALAEAPSQNNPDILHNNPDITRYFYMLNHKTRSSNFSLPGYSVKSFVSTETTKTTFNHYALHSIFYKNKMNIHLPLSVAQMNHYKEKCPREMYTHCKNVLLKYQKEDSLISKYEKSLIKQVKKALSDLKLI